MSTPRALRLNAQDNVMVAVASGEPSKSEALGYGDAEFAPWQLGAVL